MEKAVLWILIRIRIHFGLLDPDPNPHWESGGGPNFPTKVKKIQCEGLVSLR
jgi:hypothetical protein